eukprot:3546327-Pyramimonas_sp.AAC.3
MTIYLHPNERFSIFEQQRVRPELTISCSLVQSQGLTSGLKQAYRIYVEHALLRIGVFDVLSALGGAAGAAELERRRGEYVAALAKTSSGDDVEEEDSDFED